MLRLTAILALCFTLAGCDTEPVATEAAEVTTAAASTLAAGATEYVVESACPHAAAKATAHVEAHGGDAWHADHAGCDQGCDGHGADADEACSGDCGSDCDGGEDQPTS